MQLSMPWPVCSGTDARTSTHLHIAVKYTGGTLTSLGKLDGNLNLKAQSGKARKGRRPRMENRIPHGQAAMQLGTLHDTLQDKTINKTMNAWRPQAWLRLNLQSMGLPGNYHVGHQTLHETFCAVPYGRTSEQTSCRDE